MLIRKLVGLRGAFSSCVCVFYCSTLNEHLCGNLTSYQSTLKDKRLCDSLKSYFLSVVIPESDTEDFTAAVN